MFFHSQEEIGVGTFALSDTTKLFNNQANMMIIKVNTAFHRLLYRVPVGLFKALLRTRCDFQKTPVLGVKALQNSLGNQEFQATRLSGLHNSVGPVSVAPPGIRTIRTVILL
jgi:hypothetical protein